MAKGTVRTQVEFLEYCTYLPAAEIKTWLSIDLEEEVSTVNNLNCHIKLKYIEKEGVYAYN